MPRFRPLLVGFFGFLYAVCPLQSATAQDQTALPSERHSVAAAQAVEQHLLPAVDTEALRAEDRERRNEITPYRYGTVVETSLSPRDHGTWEELPGGHWLWRLRIQSKDALSLSVAFTQFQLPPGAQLYVYGPERTLVRGPYTQEDGTGGELWTPIVKDEELIVELEVPRNRRSGTDLLIGKVIHGYRSLFEPRSSDPRSKAGDCNLDVACDEADPWRDEVASVSRYTFEESGSTFLCTGSLVNNTEENQTPFFLTAEHCVSSTEQANSMVFYWNYQNPTCRTPGTTENGEVTDDNPDDQTSSGAVLRARYGSTHEDGDIAGKPDLTLVEIDESIPTEYDLFYNGWNWEDAPTQEGVTIHHPQGHGKRISFDQDPSTITGYGQTSSGDTHLRIGNWDLGTTEGGSSGGPLFNDSKQVVGVLSGGLAGCESGTSGAEDNNEPDWYGRLHSGFNQGDYDGSTLADWLDPTNSGTQSLQGISQVDEDDSTPPAKIDDLTVTTVDTTSMTLEWTATGDDGDQGTAEKYDLRYALSPIDSTNFSSAEQTLEVPEPKSAGTKQSATVNGLVPDSTYYFAIRATDDGRNDSQIGSTSGILLPDKIAPAEIKDLTISNVNTSDLTVTLTWAATGDDGRMGTATQYDLRYSSSPINTKADFQSATTVTDLPPPGPPSTEETLQLDESDGLEEDASYHVAVAAVDNAGNVAPFTTTEETAVLTKDIRVSQGTAGANQTIQFVVQETQEVRVVLYDLLGRQLGVLFDENVQEGFERVARIDAGSRGLSSGPYFLRFEGETFTRTRKVMIVK